jgi:hypothetical protein
MSETSQTVGRIAILTAGTLVFAAAWSSDGPCVGRIPTPIAWSKRGSGSADQADFNGAFTDGLRSIRPIARPSIDARLAGQLLSSAIQHPIVEQMIPAPLFSGTPALLGRSTMARVNDESRTAAAEQTRQ